MNQILIEQDVDDQDFSLPSVGTGQLDGQKEIERILHSATNRFEKFLQASMLVSPTAVMRHKDDDQREFAASDLTICNGYTGVGSMGAPLYIVVVFLNYHLMSLVNFYYDLYCMHWRKLIPLRIFL